MFADGIHYNVILKSELNARCSNKSLTEDLIISSEYIDKENIIDYCPLEFNQALNML